MGGERGTTTRMRLAGKICCNCKVPIDLGPWSGGERYCDRCTAAKHPRHKIYAHFMLAKGGWYCQFLEADLKTSLPRKLTFQDEAKILDLAQRGGASMRLEDKQAIEHGIQTGRGSMWLSLTDEQYAKLKAPRP